jgi:hypothetical protein
MKHWSWKQASCASALSLGILIAGANAASASNTGVFGGGPLYVNAASHIAELKNAGFTEVVVWNMAVSTAGDLNFNGEFPVCANGSYTGGATHSDFVGNMAILKQGSVRRVTFSVGSSNVGDFQHIRDLINAQGTGSTSALYKNFAALKAAIPSLDTIDLDDENCYDTATMVKFCVMLSDLGYTVALDPYQNSGFWTGVASQVNSQRPGTIDEVHLQCYSGGGGNSPCSWNFGGIPVYPGLDSGSQNPSQVSSTLAGWKSTCGITGGWMWLYDGFQGNAAAYASAINNTIGGPRQYAPYFMLVNQNSGKCLDLSGGNMANGAVTNQWSYDYNGANERWTLIPTENNDHFKIVSWVSGKAVSVSGDSTANSAQLVAWDYNNDSSQQWDLVDAGNGWYNIRNVRSGLLMDVSGGSTADGAKIQQYANTNTGAQRWRLQPWGGYYLEASTGNYVCVQGAGSANNSPIIQYTYQANPWFRWNFTTEGDGFYGVFSQNAASRVISVAGTSYAASANTQLYDYNVNNAGDQKVRIVPQLDGKYKFYFKHDGMSWDIPGGSASVGISLQQYPDNGNSWQKFSLVRVP